tara:strand:- start:363 stop:521 length:159 start_codon:yes stop_codon:yes gene_type:complete
MNLFEYGNDCLICKESLADDGSCCDDCDYEYQCSHCELEMKHRGLIPFEEEV